MLLLIAVIPVCIVGCKEERIEYHRRSPLVERNSPTPLPDEVTLDDGTIIRYRHATRPGIVGHEGADGSKPFEIREEAEDGTITLRNLLPEHVLANLLACLRQQEYQLIWDQLLCTKTREEYDLRENGFAGFAEYMQKHRHDLISTLTRMIAGLPTHETSVTRLGGDITRCRLRPQISEGFKFTFVDVYKEGLQQKLLLIR